MNFDLTDKQRLLQKTVMEFTRQVIESIAAEIGSIEEIPESLIKKMSELKIFEMTLPEKYGGAGKGTLECILAIEQLAYSGSVVWRLVSINNSISESIQKFGNAKQKDKYLRQVCAGNIFSNVQFIEAADGSASGVHNFKFTGSYDAKNGHALLFIKNGSGHYTAFILDNDLSENSIVPINVINGSTSIEAAEAYISKHRIPLANILAKEGSGIEVLMELTSIEKIHQCGACLGIAGAALVEAISYEKTGNIKQKTQSDENDSQWMLDEMQSKLNAARWVTYRAAYLKDKRAPDWTAEAATAKMFVIPAAMKIVELSKRILDSENNINKNKIERLYRAISEASTLCINNKNGKPDI